MVYRLPREGLFANVEGLLRQEPPFPPRWMTVVTPLGVVRAFAFTHPGKSTGYTGHLADETIADALARSVGMIGSMAQYVYLTAQHLERLGLCDERLWRMQERSPSGLSWLSRVKYRADSRQADGNNDFCLNGSV